MQGMCRGKGQADAVLEAVLDNGTTIPKHYIMAKEDITMQRLELISVIGALKRMKRSAQITIYTDSKDICTNVRKGYIDNWIENGWVTKKGKDIKNKDLWQQLAASMREHDIDFIYSTNTPYFGVQKYTLDNTEFKVQEYTEVFGN